MELNKSSSEDLELKEIISGKIFLQAQKIPFVHFPHYCKIKDVLKVLTEEWNLTFPKIMLLIVSDHASAKAWGSHHQLENFVKGLIKISNSTSMWIFTNGFNIGISKVIGDGVQADYNKRHSQICYRHTKQLKEVVRAQLIGLCQDNMLTYHDQFENPEKILKLKNAGNSIEEQKFNLNPYHSHFLIIQNESSRKDNGNRFLLQLIDVLHSSKNSASEEDKNTFPSSPVPIIAILIQGNLNSIHYILAHLKRKLPILIIKGSGGLADIIAYAYYEVRRSVQKIKDKDYVETVLRRGLNDKIISIFPSLKDNKMAQNFLCGRILECIECAEPPELKHITVLNVLNLTCKMEDLPVHILKVLFKSERFDAINLHAQLERDLLLTIDWNCPEIALTNIFYRDPTFKVRNYLFEKALLGEGRETFVSLFLENGFDIYKYLSASRLIHLFEHALTETFFKEVCWEGILGYEKITKLDNYFLDSDLNWIIRNLSGIHIDISTNELNQNSMGVFDSSYPKDDVVDFANRKAIIALIIWSLLSNRPELAMTLWRHADQPIMSALAASLILDKMVVFINETKTQENIAELNKKFAAMAVGVYDLVYSDMPSKAYDVLNVRMEEWGGHSLIEMASISQNRSFVAHPCCQKWVTNQFLGNIKIRDLAWGFITFPVYIKIILCAFFLFPMYFWVRFKETNIHEFVEEEDFEGDPYLLPQKKEEKRGITKEDTGRSHLLKYHYPPLWKMIFWMWSAPITKFWVSNIFYIIYLVLFSVAVLWPSCGNIYLDAFICLWTCLIAFDSTYLVFALHEAFPNIPLFGSCLEIVYIICFVIFFFLLRISGIYAFADPYSGKILICGGLLYFYYRMIVIYLPISSTLGPLLYRVKTMITVDFVNYMKLVVFVLIGNGIAMQAILYPDYPLIPELIRKSFHKTFMTFFMTPVEELTDVGSNCIKWEQKPSGPTMCRVGEFVDGKCSGGIGFWPYILVFQYVLLLKLILNTVLFALFNNTGAKIGSEMDSIWKFQRYKLIVNFSNSLRLPAPLNIFSLMAVLYNFVLRCCKHGLTFHQKKETKDENDTKKTQTLMSSIECSYWKHFTSDYYTDKEQEKKEEAYTKKELDIITQLSDDLNMKEILIYRAKAQITQLESDLYYTHAHLETLKYHTKKDETSRSISLHSLSRESPYPRTKIQRFPVPDKYVPWEVMWLHYEPLAYTLPKENFFVGLQPFVDDDILQKDKGEKPDVQTYKWNLESIDINGVYRNRKSWIKDRKNEPMTYRLDVYNLPRNPMGRTGLCGKGALPRWGPNHNVFVIITRWRKKKADQINPAVIGSTDHLEYVETWLMKKKDLSLPGGFVWAENKYEVIQSCFKMEKNSEPWMYSEDMIKFFKDHTMGVPKEESGVKEKEKDLFKSRMVYCGYMDDQMNTDQAWKEVELWHIHYKVWTNLNKKFKANIRWRLLSEDVFIQLPYGQTTLLQDAIRYLKAKIAQS